VKKILLGLLALVALVIVGVLGMATTQPDVLHVERSLAMAATPADVFPFANDFQRFQDWQPWRDLDPDQQVDFSDPASGEGAWYTWKGNDDVGQGKMTVVSASLSDDRARVEHSLEFIAPWQAHADTAVTATAQGEGVTVTWSYDQDQDLMGKAMGLFMDMDSMLGGDFDKGLANLKPMAEEAATRRVEAERRAEAEAAAAAAMAEGAADDGGEGVE